MKRSIGMMTALAAAFSAAPAMGEETFVNTFDGGQNVGSWSFGTGGGNIVNNGGNPGAYFQDPFVDTFAPRPRTTFGIDSLFTGDYRADGVTSLGIDLITFSVDFSADGRPLSVMLISDNDTPGNFNDDWAVFHIGPFNVPLPGQGWLSYDFEIPAASKSLPPGWSFLQFGPGSPPNPDWNDVITDVDQLMFFYGDPELVFIFQAWSLGMDNCRITFAGDDIAIVGSDPPDGAIDARQPSDPDGSNPAGWDSIELTFNGDTAGLTADDFTVTVDPAGVAPDVVDVATDGNTATLTFDGFIPLVRWTMVTHDSSGTSARIAYLPADVNNDCISTANDVLELIDFLNGVTGPFAEHRTDIDRSGASNANDVLRIIDLLNGAGVYDVFLGAELPCGDSVPENDLCEDAIPIATPVFIEGTTLGATTDGVPTCDGVENDGPGVWYKIVGGNKIYTASLCGNADFDTRITVYRNGCELVDCAEGNDDFCGEQSQVAWCAFGGVEYHILVHGPMAESGEFAMTVTEDVLFCAEP